MGGAGPEKAKTNKRSIMAIEAWSCCILLLELLSGLPEMPCRQEQVYQFSLKTIPNPLHFILSVLTDHAVFLLSMLKSRLMRHVPS